MHIGAGCQYKSPRVQAVFRERDGLSLPEIAASADRVNGRDIVQSQPAQRLGHGMVLYLLQAALEPMEKVDPSIMPGPAAACHWERQQVYGLASVLA